MGAILFVDVRDRYGVTQVVVRDNEALVQEANKLRTEMVIGVHRSGEQGIYHCAGATMVTRVAFCQALARKLGADERLIEPVKLSELKFD